MFTYSFLIKYEVRHIGMEKLYNKVKIFKARYKEDKRYLLIL